MAIELEVVGDERAAARRAAELIAAAGAAAAAERGPFGFAMSGGRSPWAMLAILGELRGDALGGRPSSSRSTSGSPRPAARTAT